MASVKITAATFDLTFMQGSRLDANTLKIIWKTGSPPTPVDLSGWSAHAQFRASLRAESPIFDLLSSNGSIVLNEEPGSIELIITEAQSSAATVYGGVWDLEMTDPGGIQTRLLQGKWMMDREVTHAE